MPHTGSNPVWPEAASREAASQEAAAQSPPVITVLPGAHGAAAQEAVAREAAAQENTENTPPPTKHARNTPPPTKRARVSPAQQDAEGVIFVDNHSEVSHELTASPLGHDGSANLFLNILMSIMICISSRSLS